MVKYSFEVKNPETSSKAKIDYLRVHYKHMHEIAHVIRGKKVLAAIKYLEDVLAKKNVIPFFRHNTGTGRHAQAKLVHASGDLCGWPEKATKMMIGLLKNAIANAEPKRLKSADLVISQIIVNRAIQMRRRIYRAHGRVGPPVTQTAAAEPKRTILKLKAKRGAKLRLAQSLVKKN